MEKDSQIVSEARGLQWLIGQVHVNVPFRLLQGDHLAGFIQNRINPEIVFDSEALECFTLSDFQRVADKLLSHDLRITLHAPFTDLSPGSIDPDVLAVTRRRFDQMVELIPVFRAAAMVCHAGYDWKHCGYFRDRWLQVSIETWSRLGRRIRDAGACLMLENVYEQDPEEILPLFEQLAGLRVGFCLDTGHQSAFSPAPMDRWLNVLGAFIGHLHLHDNQGRRDDHLGLGEGIIDFRQLFDYLKQRGRPATITLEPHGEGHLWTSLHYLAGIWPWSRAQNH